MISDAKYDYHFIFVIVRIDVFIYRVFVGCYHYCLEMEAFVLFCF